MRGTGGKIVERKGTGLMKGWRRKVEKKTLKKAIIFV